MSDGSPIYKTRFYSDCIGVFQGGGCRAAAFGGAYASAFELGVRFSEVAGTSAGSITAALIAAGATPEYLIDKFKELDFPTLLKDPVRSTFTKPLRMVKLANKVPFKGETLDSIVRIARFGGLHSSVGVEAWVESCLKELTGKENGPVNFSELVMPLHVVAGDLSTMKPRVWGQDVTPKQSVAHAVRASCNIPLFFQPVEEGSALLVDGGIVSNLPHFLFAEKLSLNSRDKKRVLFFMLEANEERKRADDSKELVSQVSSLAIEGSTAVQLSFAPDIARIVIPTGNIRATDFFAMNNEVIEVLIASGQTAAKAFIEGELLKTHGAQPESLTVFDEHEAFLAVCEQIYTTKSDVRISMPTTKWFWELFPTILHWRKIGIRVVAFAQPISTNYPDGAKEAQRRELLEGLGVELLEVATLPFKGMFFDAPGAGARALIYPEEQTDYEPAARFYSGRLDQSALSALYDKIQGLVGESVTSSNQPTLVSTDPAVILDKLKENVPVYREPGVLLAIEDVEVSKVFLISRYVRAFRYKQIATLIEHYNDEELELFAPAKVTLSGGAESLVTPPVVEETGGKFVALEGNTRFLHCYNAGITQIKAVVVRGVKVELPGKPVPLHQVRITARKHAPDERMIGYNHDLFRSIERAIRPIPNQ